MDAFFLSLDAVSDQLLWDLAATALFLFYGPKNVSRGLKGSIASGRNSAARHTATVYGLYPSLRKVRDIPA